MGEEGGLLRFENTRTTTCVISGWPQVVAVQAKGTRASSRHAVGGTMLFGWNWSPRRAVPKVSLRPGAAGYAILASADNPTGANPPRQCPKAHRLIVTAPNSKERVKLSAWLPHDATYLPLCGKHTLVSPVLPLRSIVGK